MGVEIGIKFENVLSLFLPVFLRLSLILLVFLTLFDSGLLIPPLLSPFFSFTLCFTPSFILLLLLLPLSPSSFSFPFDVKEAPVCPTGSFRTRYECSNQKQNCLSLLFLRVSLLLSSFFFFFFQFSITNGRIQQTKFNK